MCTLHAPVFLTLMASGKSIQSAPYDLTLKSIAVNNLNYDNAFANDTTMMTLMVTTIINGSATTTSQFVESCVLKNTKMNSSLSFEAGAASLLCTLFAVIYMTITTDSDELNTMCIQNVDTVVGEEEPAFSLLIIRVMFWSFVWFHACLLQSIAPSDAPRRVDHNAIMRTFALWCLCRAAPRDKGWYSFGGSVLVYFGWIIAFFQKYNFDAHWMMETDFILFLMQILVDVVLTLGHRYDTHTTIRIVLNVRLCYMALAGCLIHVLAFKKYSY